jgi:hypothetical protein
MKCNGKSEPMFLKKEDILVLPGIILFINVRIVVMANVIN